MWGPVAVASSCFSCLIVLVVFAGDRLDFEAEVLLEDILKA